MTMRNHAKQLAPLLLALGLGALLPSCAAPTAPQGFTLAIQLTQVNVAAVDSLRLTFAPVMEGTMLAHFLQPTHGTSFENGDITITVDSVSGLLTMTISGTYFAAHAMTVGTTGADPRFELEIWSDDRSVHAAPQVRATVIHNGNQVATGVAYLPSWPLVLGDSSQINVPCMTGLEMMCANLL
jgi:hypothetical protein